MDILGVRVDNLEKKEILEKVSDFLDGDDFRKIATINPEIILTAQEDEEFKKILNSCELAIADGIGIKFAFWRFGKRLKCRMTGIDLMLEILRVANEKKLKIFLAANKNGLSSFEETRNAILKIYPNLEISGENINCHSDPALAGEESQKNIANDNYSGSFTPMKIGVQDDIAGESSIIFCNFGAPYQEKFLNSAKSGTIKLAVGVGGSFDYLTGKLKRAPRWMRFFGVEWLWRLILQPKRIKRIFNAVIVFSVKVLFQKNN